MVPTHTQEQWMNTCDDAAIFFFTTTILRSQTYAVTCICTFYIGTDAIKPLFLGGKLAHGILL